MELSRSAVGMYSTAARRKCRHRWPRSKREWSPLDCLASPIWWRWETKVSAHPSMPAFFFFFFIYFYLRPGGLFKLLVNFKWGLDYPSCHCAIANFGRFVIKKYISQPFYPCQDIIWENLANIYVYSGLWIFPWGWNPAGCASLIAKETCFQLMCRFFQCNCLIFLVQALKRQTKK